MYWAIASMSRSLKNSTIRRMTWTFWADTVNPVSRSLALPAQRGALDGLREQHLLGEDQVLAVVVGDLVLVPHGDRVEGAGDFAVAAEDAASEVDLVDLGIALAGRDAMVGIVLGGDDP